MAFSGKGIAAAAGWMAFVAVAGAAMADGAISGRFIKVGSFSPEDAPGPIRVVGVKAGPFHPDKLKTWHWQWDNPVIEPKEGGPHRNLYGPALFRDHFGTWLYYFGWQPHGGVNDIHDRIFVARRRGNRWETAEESVLSPDGAGAAYDDRYEAGEWHVGDPYVIEAHGKYWMFYTSERFDRRVEWNDRELVYLRHTVGVAESDDRIHWRKKGPIRIDIPGYQGLPFGVAQTVGDEVRLHIGIARPCVIRCGSVWRMYFDRSAPNSTTDETPRLEYPGVAAVRAKYVAYAETSDPAMMDWEFKGDLKPPADRIDVDPDVALINGRYILVTASYGRGFFGAVSDDGVNFEPVPPHPAAEAVHQDAMLPPHGSSVFPDAEEHDYDYLVASPALIHDGERLYGMLYGTSKKDAPMIHGRICAVYLQRRVVFQVADGRVWDQATADGPDALYLRGGDGPLPSEGEFLIYDTDGVTLLHRTGPMPVTAGEVYSYEP